MTPTQIHALRLLNIQEDKRGFVRQCVLKSAGIPRLTLDCLRKRKLVEFRVPASKGLFWQTNHQWRLTLAGIRAADALPPFKAPVIIKDFPGRAVEAELRATGKLPNE